ARAFEGFDAALDGDPVAMGRGDVEFRTGVDHGNTNQAVFVHDVLLGETGGLEHDRGRVVEHLEVTRIINDVGGVAVAPLDLNITRWRDQGAPYSGAMRGDASSRTTSPLR